MTHDELCRMEQSKLVKLIDEGKLVYLPCNVGENVFAQNPYAPADFIPKDKEIEQWKVKHIGITVECMGWKQFVNFDDFGKTVFLTLEEAEKALKERADNE